MSTKIVQKFFEKVAQDKSLQAKMKVLGEKHNKAPNDSQEELSAVAEFASAAGFQFTANDLAEARKAKVRPLTGAKQKDVVGQNCVGDYYYSWWCINRSVLY